MPFTPEQAKAAAQRSAEVRRENRERKRLLSETGYAGEASASDGGASQDGTTPSGVRSSATDDRVALVRVPVPIGSIIRKLSADAQAGETSAARELRAWLSQFPPDVDAADVGDLDRVTRTAIAAILARALAEHEESLQAAPFEAGTQDGFASALQQEAVEPVGHPRGSGSHPNERGSRPLTAIEEDPAPSVCPRECTCPPGGPCQTNGSHTSDGTGQMSVDDCIEDALADVEAGRGTFHENDESFLASLEEEANDGRSE